MKDKEKFEIKFLCETLLYIYSLFTILFIIVRMNQPDQPEQNSQPSMQPQDQQQPHQEPQIIVHEVKEVEDEPQKVQVRYFNEGSFFSSNQHSSDLQPKPVESVIENANIKAEGSPDKEIEAEPSQQEEEGEQEKEEDEQGNNRKQSSDQNREDNDTSQLQTTGGKKCFNKLCNSKKIYKKIRSRVQTQRYRFLCKNCYENYINNSFCEFCEQIYSNYENEEDDTKWVGCDKCERWNHIECERKYRHKNFQISKDKDTQYECLACSKKNRPVPTPHENTNESHKRKPAERDYEGTRNYRTKVQINKDERVLIFHKNPQAFPCLQSFLQTYNFRLWLNDANIRDDLESLRISSRRPPPVEEEPKKTKKVKLDYCL